MCMSLGQAFHSSAFPGPGPWLFPLLRWILSPALGVAISRESRERPGLSPSLCPLFLARPKSYPGEQTLELWWGEPP